MFSLFIDRSDSQSKLDSHSAYNLYDVLKKILFVSKKDAHKKERIHPCADKPGFQFLISCFHNYEINYVCMCIHCNDTWSICPSVCMSVCMSVFLSICLSVCMHACICLSIYIIILILFMCGLHIEFLRLKQREIHWKKQSKCLAVLVKKVLRKTFCFIFY